MREALAQVTEFFRVYGHEAPDGPRTLPVATLKLRLRLIYEELGEYQIAAEDKDISGLAKELADLAYVVVGTAVAHGLTRFDEIFAEVHRSNMSKLGRDGKPVLRADGKILKGPDYAPPDFAPLLTAVPRGT